MSLLVKLRRLQDWQVEFLFLACLALISLVLFRNKDLDIWTAQFFYHPENLKDPWFEAQNGLWLFFYRAAPWITGILLLGSLGILLLAQIKSQFRKYRIHAVYIFLAVALGPGLVVNAVLKPYWGRPRPREVMELGGHYEYRPFYAPAVGEPGKSFPCGHCSVGFTYGIFWLIFRKRNLLMASGFLLGSSAFGILMGIGRIADGGHFLSDVVWSGIITWFLGVWLYHFGLKIPQRTGVSSSEVSKSHRWGKIFEENRFFVYGFYLVLALITVGALLTASPFYKEIQFSASETKIENLRIKIDQGDVELSLNANLPTAFSISGKAKGFGFPKNHVDWLCHSDSESTECDLTRHGFFADYETNFKVEVNPNQSAHLDLSLGRGRLISPEASKMPANYHVYRGSSRP